MEYIKIVATLLSEWVNLNHIRTLEHNKNHIEDSMRKPMFLSAYVVQFEICIVNFAEIWTTILNAPVNDKIVIKNNYYA